MSETDVTQAATVAVKVARAELVKRFLIVAITVLVIIVLVIGYRTLTTVQTAVAEIRATQQSGSPALKAIAAQQDEIEEAANASTSLNKLILGCINPESKCAKETAAREAAQAGAYNAAVISAHYCTDRLLPADYTLHELTACVGRILDGTEARP